MNVRDTSHAAFRSLDLQGQERELMRLVHQHYPFPASFTRKELAAKIGWEINRICGRVNSLVEKGYLKEYQQIRDGGHLLSIAPPKAAAPAPAQTGESAPSAASVATDMRGTLRPPVNVPPVAVAYPFPTMVMPGTGEVVEIVSERLVTYPGKSSDGKDIEVSYTQVMTRPIRGARRAA